MGTLLTLKSRILGEVGKIQKEILQKVNENALLISAFVLEMMFIIFLKLSLNKIHIM